MFKVPVILMTILIANPSMRLVKCSWGPIDPPGIAPVPMPMRPIGFAPIYNGNNAGALLNPYVDPSRPQTPQWSSPPLRPTGIDLNGNAGHCLPHEYDLPGSHSIFFGCRKPEDKLLFVENVYKPKRWFSAREKLIDFPSAAPKGYVHDENITAIWCYDLQGYGAGGFFNVQDGGIGKRRVRLHLYQKDRNVPLHFKVEIYGRKMNVTRTPSAATVGRGSVIHL